MIVEEKGAVTLEIYKISSQGILSRELKFSEENEDKYWLILTPEELQSNNNVFKFSDKTIDECFTDRQSPRMEIYDMYSFGVLNVINKTDNFILASELNFYITDRYLIFVTKDTELDIIKEIKKEVTDYYFDLGKILYLLLDKLTATDNQILNEIEDDISNIEEMIIKGENINYIVDIINIRKQLLQLKRYYEPLLDITEVLTENENTILSESSLRYFNILKDKIERLNKNVANLKDYITQVREAYQAQVDINLNKTMKIFTVITAVFLPLSLIAGWYGMNFKNMPEISWAFGYPFAFFLSGLVLMVCIIFFKKHGFI